MSDIIITLDKDRNITKVEGIPADTKVRIRRPAASISEEPPRLKWYQVEWKKAAGRSFVKCFSEGEARKMASEAADQATKHPLVFEGGKKIAHEWFEVTEEDPYIDSVNTDEEAEQVGREIDGEGR